MGKIQPHRGRGKQLGYPTINIPLTQNIKHGVYAGYVRYHCTPLPAAIFVGRAVSFNETEAQVEAYVLDWSDSFPDQEVVIEGHNFIRENRKFSSTTELQMQIAKDIIQVRSCLPELYKIS